MIYLDHNATCPMLDEVLQQMLPWLGRPANPASAHQAGQRAASAVELAREHVAALVGGVPEGVVFTSGATEANHLFVRGVAHGIEPATWCTSALEHPSVGGAASAIAERGWHIRQMPVSRDGVVNLDDTDLDGVAGLSLQAVNHETGVIQPIDEAHALCQEHGIALHVDATQAAGKLSLALGGVGGVVLSAHKLGGPAGVGALVLPHGEPFPALLRGGSQERGRRAGTVNTAGVVGFGEACRIAQQTLKSRQQRWRAQRERVLQVALSIGMRVPSGDAATVSNTLCVVAPGLRGESMVQALDLRGLCVSSGAACASGSLRASPVLTAMGDPDAHGVLRISFGPGTTDHHVAELIAALPEVVRSLRDLAALGFE